MNYMTSLPVGQGNVENSFTEVDNLSQLSFSLRDSSNNSSKLSVLETHNKPTLIGANSVLEANQTPNNEYSIVNRYQHLRIPFTSFDFCSKSLFPDRESQI